MNKKQGDATKGGFPIHRKITVKILLFVSFAILLMFARHLRLTSTLLGIFIFLYLLYPDRRMRNGWIPVTILLLMTLVGNMFFHPGRVLVDLGFTTVTDRGLEAGIINSMRLMGLIVGAKILTITTPMDDILSTLKNVFHPLHKVGIKTDTFFETARISLRILPGIREMAVKEFKKKNQENNSSRFHQKILLAVGLLFPLMIRILKEPELLLPEQNGSHCQPDHEKGQRQSA